MRPETSQRSDVPPVESAVRPVEPTVLPVDSVLGELTEALHRAGRAVLEAPPGAGKTTRVPLALLEVVTHGRIVVLEPRRVAARAAAQRLASTLHERVGETVGLTTRDDRRTSAATRIEVVTEGVLLRRLQRDPALDGVGLLMFDEFHERNLEADLALAFAVESRAALRDDLALLVASATLDGQRVAGLLDDAPVVRAEGRRHPVTVEHREQPGLRRLPTAVADAVEDLLTDTTGERGGDVLVFLPGAREIERCAELLTERALPGAPVVRRLHGSLPAGQQDAALAADPHGRRRIVLATDLAESSLTVEGVTAVVDAGWSREPRFDAATGMTGLVTVPASRAAAAQRAGRAGRLAPGHAVRLWPEREHAGRDPDPRPALHTDDLTGAALEVAAWGADIAELALLDQPPPAGWERARTTLAQLGALDDDGRITAHGRALARLPVHPRLGHLLLAGRDRGLAQLATEVAAVLADRDLLRPGPDAPDADLTARIRYLRGEPPPGGSSGHRGRRDRARREQRRLARLLDVEVADPDGGPAHGPGRRGAESGGRPAAAAADPDRAGELVLLGWPDRLAGRRAGRRGSFRLAGGRGAQLPDADPLADADLLAVAHLDRGAEVARIHLAAPVDAATVRTVLAPQLSEVDEVSWRDGDVVAERREQCGAVVLDRARLADPDGDRLLGALVDGLRTEGLTLLRCRDDDRQLQARVALLRATLGEQWPDLSDAALLADADRRLAPFLTGVRRRSELAGVALAQVLRAALTARQLAELERLAPTHLTVPSGSRLRLDYTAGDRPVLAARVQELFGATVTPSVVDGRVPVLLHLLSPAHRPVQVTDDLAGFWQRGYPQVRAELRGRYPKHAWPEDPLAAAPRRGSKRGRT